MVRRTLVALLIGAFVLMWIVAITSYTSLPERFPLHFAADGTPDGFGQKSPITWFAIPAIFTVMTGIFVGFVYLTRWLAVRHAGLVNLPERDTFVRLSLEDRVKAVEPLADLGLAMPIALCSLSVYVQFGSAMVARQETRSLPGWPVLLVLVYSFVALATSIVRTRRVVLDLAKRKA